MSLPCPTCGNARTRIDNTRTLEKVGGYTVQRNRYCERCGLEFRTREYVYNGSNRAKLTRDQVKKIRSLVAKGGKHRDVAALFGVSSPTITKIVNYNLWNERYTNSAAHKNGTVDND